MQCNGKRYDARWRMCVLILFHLTFGSVSAVLYGCNQDECEPLLMKCDGNRLMKCSPGDDSHFADYDKWVEEMDCSAFGATCRPGEHIDFEPSQAEHYESLNFFRYLSHGCAIDSITCDGDTELQCTTDNSLIVGCSYSNEPAVMIIAENKENHPLCVEKSNGLAGFAYLPGECVSYREMTCMQEQSRVACSNGLWSLKSSNCARYGEKCETSIDTDGYSTAYCTSVEP